MDESKFLNDIIKELHMRKDDLESTMEFAAVKENKEVLERLRIDVKKMNKAINLLKEIK